VDVLAGECRQGRWSGKLLIIIHKKALPQGVQHGRDLTKSTEQQSHFWQRGRKIYMITGDRRENGIARRCFSLIAPHLVACILVANWEGQQILQTSQEIGDVLIELVSI